MAQLFFKYGTMNCGKSLQLLAIAHNYEEQGKEVMIMTSALDTRSGLGVVSSRVGIELPAIPLSNSDWPSGVLEEHRDNKRINCVLIDEAQFLTAEQVDQLATVVVDQWGIPVICFGLKTDFTGHFFEGSKALFEQADKLEEIKTVCQYCDRKATMNLRKVDGKPVYEGEQIQIGDQEYVSVCRRHYHAVPLDF